MGSQTPPAAASRPVAVTGGRITWIGADTELLTATTEIEYGRPPPGSPRAWSPCVAKIQCAACIVHRSCGPHVSTTRPSKGRHYTESSQVRLCGPNATADQPHPHRRRPAPRPFEQLTDP